LEKETVEPETWAETEGNADSPGFKTPHPLPKCKPIPIIF